MSDLFMSASHVLRDNLIVQLKNENEFLRKKVFNKTSHFFGKKVLRKAHSFMGTPVEEAHGTFVDFATTCSQCHILLTSEESQNKYISLEYFENIEFLEDV